MQNNYLQDLLNRMKAQNAPAQGQYQAQVQPQQQQQNPNTQGQGMQLSQMPEFLRQAIARQQGQQATPTDGQGPVQLPYMGGMPDQRTEMLPPSQPTPNQRAPRYWGGGGGGQISQRPMPEMLPAPQPTVRRRSGMQQPVRGTDRRWTGSEMPDQRPGQLPDMDWTPDKRSGKPPRQMEFTDGQGMFKDGQPPVPGQRAGGVQISQRPRSVQGWQQPGMQPALQQMPEFLRQEIARQQWQQATPMQGQSGDRR